MIELNRDTISVKLVEQWSVGLWETEQLQHGVTKIGTYLVNNHSRNEKRRTSVDGEE